MRPSHLFPKNEPELFFLCSNTLLEVFEKDRNFANLVIVPYFMIDVWMAVFHLAFSPTLKNLVSSEASEKYRAVYTRMLHGDLMVSTDILCRCTVSLLACGQSSKIQWLINEASKTITKLLCHPNQTGFFSTLLAFLFSEPNDRTLRQIAQSISKIPKDESADTYWRCISPQMINTLHMKDHAGSSEKYRQVVAYIFSNMLTSSRPLAVELVLLPVTCATFAPFVILFKLNLVQGSAARLYQLLENQRRRCGAEEEHKKKPSIVEVQDPSLHASRLIGNDRDFFSKLAPNFEKKASSITQLEKIAELWKDNSVKSWVDRFIGFQDGQVIMSTDMIIRCLKDLSLLCLSTPCVQDFSPVIPVLFEIWCLSSSCLETASKNTASILGVRDSAQLLLEKYFSMVDKDVAIEQLIYLCVQDEIDWNRLCVNYGYAERKGKHCTVPGFRLCFTEKNELVLMSSDFNPSETCTRDSLTKPRYMTEFLKLIDRGEDQDRSASRNLAGCLFLYLLEQVLLTSSILASLSSLDSGFDSLERLNNAIALASQHYIVVTKFVLYMAESLGARVLRDAIQICLFLKNMLQSESEEILLLSLAILEQVVSGSLLSKEEASILLVDLVTTLRVLSHHDNRQIATSANSLRASILEDCEMQASPKGDSKEKSTQKDPKDPLNPPKRKWVERPHIETLDEALSSIMNPVPPIRAGGLISLRRLLLLEDPETISRLQEVMDTFYKHLSNEDSYVYLSAIQGLAAVADVSFDLAFPLLSGQYVNYAKPLELRLSVGEALLQVARRLGQCLVKYREEFIHLFMTSVHKDPEPLMRASALADLAETCELLKYGLLPFIEEIMATMYELIVVEKDEHVRRGGVYLLTRLFKGLSEDILKVIPGHLKRLKSVLALVELEDKDVVTREHARLALLELEHSLNIAVASNIENDERKEFLDPQGFYSSLNIFKQ
ncbi:transport and Golgi organization protein 6 homolog [Schistocerca gregaria]|uniref:transport and Golgi organization protein 6 homolog n=1 Tax=Schistocerca gregaria TaxID=7010 RepID=UPI00211F0F7F|nr:transport and Golgi organization protein 6 homolog [Schistocerca gregaria]